MQKKLSELEQRVEDTKPSLSGIMSGIQRHHAKLYYSGARKNWDLAGYELSQIREGIGRSAASYTSAKSGPALMKPALDALTVSIERHNFDGFIHEFSALTQSCNQCHQDGGHKYIAIEIPGPGMFTDQNFRH